MRSRAIFLAVAILLVAAFAALNWSEIIRPAPLLFGPVLIDAPMGAILLGLLTLATIAFLLSAGAMRTQSLVESRTHHKTLEAQRTLADKAEASRFTDLRQHLDSQLRELRERDTVASTELRTQLEQINRTLAARLSEMEHRIESRMEGVAGHGSGSASTLLPSTMSAQHVQATAARHQDAQEEQLREVEARQERARADAAESVRQTEKAASGERPPEGGWRRWLG